MKIEKEGDSTIKAGCFEWYCNLPDPFYEHLTRAIMHADNKNKFKLENMFPIISRAHREKSWFTVTKTEIPIVLNVENTKIVRPNKEDCPGRKDG